MYRNTPYVRMMELIGLRFLKNYVNIYNSNDVINVNVVTRSDIIQYHLLKELGIKINNLDRFTWES